MIEGKPDDVVRALGFSPTVTETCKVELKRSHGEIEEVGYVVFRPLDSSRQEVLIKFEGEKGDKTHLIKLAGADHEAEAQYLESLERRHHRYPIQFDPRVWYASELSSAGRARGDNETGETNLETVFVLDFHVGRQDLKIAAAEVSVKKLVTVGRQIGNTVILPDPSVSEHHATFLLKTVQGRLCVVLRDERGESGCVVNDRTVKGEEAVIQPGDYVRIGCFRVAVKGSQHG